MRFTVFAAAALALAACSPSETGTKEAPAPAAEPAEEAEPATGCPVLASRDWTARIEEGSLVVEGVVDLPTPGYALSFTQGPADRSAVPTQRLLLAATAPEGMVVQMIATETVRFEGPAIAPRYKAVLVLCGGAPLAEIADIGPVE